MSRDWGKEFGLDFHETPKPMSDEGIELRIKQHKKYLTDDAWAFIFRIVELRDEVDALKERLASYE